jgi:hypothetical protein
MRKKFRLIQRVMRALLAMPAVSRRVKMRARVTKMKKAM